MKRYPTKMPATIPPTQASSEEASSIFDLDEALTKCQEVLRREIANLLMESSSKKLSAPSARDLCAYIKLISELKQEKLKELDGLTDAELEEIVLKK